MRQALIDQQNQYLVARQRGFRLAADMVADAWAAFPEVLAIAVIGSVAKPLWKEVPRFRAFRREGIKVWHECGDLDLALWVNSQHRLDDLRKAANKALQNAFKADVGVSIASHQLDVFLFEPGSDRHLGRLCSFNACPKEKRACLVPGCGAIPFNKKVDGFKPDADLLAPAAHAMLYRQETGRLQSALDLAPPLFHNPNSKMGKRSIARNTGWVAGVLQEPQYSGDGHGTVKPPARRTTALDRASGPSTAPSPP
jgi:hypothetical protein